MSDGGRAADRLTLALDAVPDGGAVGLDPHPATGTFRLFVVRLGDRLFAYRNRCPHRGLPLDDAGVFLTDDGRFILCHNHIALFRIDDGACVDGPCGGRGLEPVAIEIAGAAPD